MALKKKRSSTNARKASKRRTQEELLKDLPPLSLFSRERREELGYTQEQLAFRSGLNLRFIKEFERGKKTARLDKVIALLNFLGADLKAEMRNER